MALPRPAMAGLIDTDRGSELLTAVREKGAACERIILQAMRVPLLGPFVPSLKRTLQLSASLRLLLSSLSNPSPPIMASLYGLLGSQKLVLGFLMPLVSASTPVAVLQAHVRDGRFILQRKVLAMVRLYSLTLHELSCHMLEEQTRLRQQHTRSIETRFPAADADAAGADATPASPLSPKSPLSPSLSRTVSKQKHYLSAAASVRSLDERAELGGPGSAIGTCSVELPGECGLQPGLSSPLSFADDWFGDDSLSPYAIEKVAAARALEAREIMHTYREFPLYTPISAGGSHANMLVGADGGGSRHRSAAASASAPPPPFCADLFPPSRSPLAQVADFVPQVRQAEFLALQAAFQRLNSHVSTTSSSSRHGPRVIFIQGDAGIGGQEYAKFVLHNLLLPAPPPPPAATAMATQEDFGAAATASSVTTSSSFTSSASSSAPTFSPTSPPSYTAAYTPLHFSFSRFAQAEYTRPRREGILDTLQRKLATASSNRIQTEEAARRRVQSAASAAAAGGGGGSSSSGAAYGLGESAGGAAIISTVADIVTADDANKRAHHHTGPSSAAAASLSAAATAAAASTRSSVPALDNEKFDSMHRFRVDALTVAKQLTSPLSAQGSARVGGGEVESGAYASENIVLDRYRRHVLDTPSILLLSNVHRLDQPEVERLLFPPSTGPTNAQHRNRAIVIVQSRQPLKALMLRCALHSVSQQLLPLDDMQAMNALIKLNERRSALLRARQRAAQQQQQQQPQPLPPTLEPGHAIRLSQLMRGSMFVGQFLLKQVEYAAAAAASASAASASAAAAELVCASLESKKPPPSAQFLADNFFPASHQSAGIAPAVSWAFGLLSPRAQGLFVCLVFVLAGAQSFTWRTVRGVMMHYSVPSADGDSTEPEAEGLSVAGVPIQRHKASSAPLRPEYLELDLRELMGRGFVVRLGELDSDNRGEAFVDEDEQREREEEEEQAPAHGMPATAAHATPGSSSSPPPASFSSLLHARFVIHDILKQFGLSIAHSAKPLKGSKSRPHGQRGGAARKQAPSSSSSSSSTVSTRDFLKYLGPDMHAQWIAPETAPRFQRSLQLHLVSHMSHQLQHLDSTFQKWWQGYSASEQRDAMAAEEGEDDDDDIDSDTHEEEQEQSTQQQQVAALGSPNQRRQSLSALSPNAQVRAEQLRQRATLRERLTASLLDDEASASAAKQEARRQSRTAAYSRSSTRTSVRNSVDSSAPLPAVRRSTLLIESRDRKESSTLPASSLRSLPPAKPTELVYKTVKRLRALIEDDEETYEERRKATEEAAAADAAVTSSTPPLRGSVLLHSPSPSPSPSPEIAARSGGEEDDDNNHGEASEQDESDDSSDDDSENEDIQRLHSALPFAEEDDCEPEVALSLPSQSTLLLRSMGANECAEFAPSSSTADESAPSSASSRLRAASSSLESAFVALHAVQELEEMEEENAAHATAVRGYIQAGSGGGASDDTYDAADFTDSSDDEYEEVAPLPSANMRASVVSRLPPMSDEARLLLEMDAAEQSARRALEEAEKLAQEENDRLAAELQALEFDAGEVVNHGRGAIDDVTTRVNSALLKPVALQETIDAAAGPLRLVQLATAVMQAVRPIRVSQRTTRPFVAAAASRASQHSTAGRSGSVRARSGTSFASSAPHTPSFIRQLQLAKAVYTFDVDLSLLLTALRYSHSCSKHNLHAVLLFAPKSLCALRLSNYINKQLLFHHLEVCKPRYSRAWLAGLWHLGEVYKSMGLLQKARDCLEELRLIAVRQGTEGLGVLFASQVGVAAVHQAQLAEGRVDKFGSCIDNFKDGEAASNAQHTAAGAGAGAAAGAAAASGSTAPPHEDSHRSDALPDVGGSSYATQPSYYPSVNGDLAYSQSSHHLDTSASFNRSTATPATAAAAASSVPPAMPRSGGTASGRKHAAKSTQMNLATQQIHTVLDAIIECYERALSTLETAQPVLLAAAVAQSPHRADVQRGVHVFARPLMFLLLRLGTWYTYKHAFQNAINVLRRGVEIKAAEVVARRQRRDKIRREAAAASGLPRTNDSGGAGAGAAPAGALNPPRPLQRGLRRAGGPTVLPSLSSLLPFSLPSSTRLLSGLLFALGLLHCRLGDLDEALSFFERSRRITARIVARRYRKERTDKDLSRGAEAAQPAAPPAARVPSLPTAFDFDLPWSPSDDAACDAADTAWTLSATFLSSLATPAQAADVMAYVRTLYMMACTHDKLAQQVQEQARSSSNSSSEQTDAASAPRSPEPPVSAASSLHTYRALVLRNAIIDIWHRVTTGHKVVSMHEDMWRVVTGMSALELA